MINSSSIDAMNKAKVVDSNGDKVGTVGQVYVDETDGHPLFATIHTGLFGTKESFVPLESASFSDGTLRVGYTKDKIKDAPNVADDGAIDDAEQDQIFDYYDGASNSRDASSGAEYENSYTEADSTAGAGALTGADVETSSTASQQAPAPAGRGTDSSDDTMTRSEERLNVGVQKVEAGRVRLRKHVITEQQTITVPVSHEEAHIEREPITDANRDQALAGPEIHEADYEVTLMAEKPVVEKETVAVEKVRLNKETVTEQQQVTEEVRKEQIDFDGADGTSR